MKISAPESEEKKGTKRKRDNEEDSDNAEHSAKLSQGSKVPEVQVKSVNTKKASQEEQTKVDAKKRKEKSSSDDSEMEVEGQICCGNKDCC